MPKYRVLDGSHTERDENGDVRLYKKDDVIESDLPLDELFVNKFRRLKSSAPVTDAPTLDEVAVADQVRAKKEQKKQKEEEEDKYELEEEGEEEEEEEELVESKLGKDVTSEFPVAQEEGLLVFQKGKAYYVTEKEDPNSAISDEPLTKKGVDKFVKSYVG